MNSTNNVNKSNVKTVKVALIAISIIIVLFTLTGNIMTTPQGVAVSLSTFESFYVYIIMACVALFGAMNNKSVNGIIFLSLLTYVWTYYLVHQMIKFLPSVIINIEPLFYVYLGSSLFLIISLFINENNNSQH